MAKKSKVARQVQREAVVERFAARRAALKRESVSPHVTADARANAMKQLHALPRDASPVRLRNRDGAHGRPRGYLRKFGLSRVAMRGAALSGNLPGVTKSSR